jgi:intracellular sulfur oxidation DsrE/DsrF family protein
MKRNDFLATAAAAGAFATTRGAAAASDVPGGTDLIERQANFDEKAFAAAVNKPADVRQLWDNVALRPGVLNNIKNTLNGLQFGFGYPAERISVVAVNHGPSTSYTYGEYVWQKYRIGDFFDFKDASGARISTNVFYQHKFPPGTSNDPNAENGTLQDTGIAALQARGVVFMTCHTAVEEQSRALIKAGYAPAGATPADVSGDILTHLIPGAVVVPGGVATLAVLQQKYGYTYATVQ